SPRTTQVRAAAASRIRDRVSRPSSDSPIETTPVAMTTAPDAGGMVARTRSSAPRGWNSRGNETGQGAGGHPGRGGGQHGRGGRVQPGVTHEQLSEQQRGDEQLRLGGHAGGGAGGDRPGGGDAEPLDRQRGHGDAEEHGGEDRAAAEPT